MHTNHNIYAYSIPASVARANAAAAIAIIALLMGGGALIFAARPDVVSLPEVSSSCSTSPRQNFMVGETVTGACSGFDLFGTANTWTAIQTFVNGFNLNSTADVQIYPRVDGFVTLTSLQTNHFIALELMPNGSPTGTTVYMELWKTTDATTATEGLETFYSTITGFWQQDVIGEHGGSISPWVFAMTPPSSSSVEAFRINTDSTVTFAKAATFNAQFTNFGFNSKNDQVKIGTGGDFIFLANTNEVFRLNYGTGGFQFTTGSIVLNTNPTYLISGSTNLFGLSNTGIKNTQGFQSVIAQALTNGGSTTTISLPVTEPDTTYAVACTTSANLGAVWATTKATTSFVLNTVSNAGASDTADCIITHQ